jgi:hypothetical protein
MLTVQAPPVDVVVPTETPLRYSVIVPSTKVVPLTDNVWSVVSKSVEKLPESVDTEVITGGGT